MLRSHAPTDLRIRRLAILIAVVFGLLLGPALAGPGIGTIQAQPSDAPAAETGEDSADDDGLPRVVNADLLAEFFNVLDRDPIIQLARSIPADIDDLLGRLPDDVGAPHLTLRTWPLVDLVIDRDAVELGDGRTAHIEPDEHEIAPNVWVEMLILVVTTTDTDGEESDEEFRLPGEAISQLAEPVFGYLSVLHPLRRIIRELDTQGGDLSEVLADICGRADLDFTFLSLEAEELRISCRLTNRTVETCLQAITSVAGWGFKVQGGDSYVRSDNIDLAEIAEVYHSRDVVNALDPEAKIEDAMSALRYKIGTALARFESERPIVVFRPGHIGADDD
jgi:hypothetical protein